MEYLVSVELDKQISGGAIDNNKIFIPSYILYEFMIMPKPN